MKGIADIFNGDLYFIFQRMQKNMVSSTAGSIMTWAKARVHLEGGSPPNLKKYITDRKYED